MKTWQDKAHRLVANAAREEWYKANFRNGKQLKKHHPYTLPDWAESLVGCMGRDEEESAKAIFLSYEGMRIT